MQYRDFNIIGQPGYYRFESCSGKSVSVKNWKTLKGVKSAIDREYPKLVKPKTTWIQGYELPNNDLIKAVSHSLIVATQEYDHVTASLLERFIKDYATRYEK